MTKIAQPVKRGGDCYMMPQQSVFMLHRVRSLLVRQRTML
jgi:hypothetical protein